MRIHIEHACDGGKGRERATQGVEISHLQMSRAPLSDHIHPVPKTILGDLSLSGEIGILSGILPSRCISLPACWIVNSHTKPSNYKSTPGYHM